MSAVKKIAKTSLVLFSAFVFLVIGMAIYFYVNMGSIAKSFTEISASQVLGVPVSIGEMDINVEELKVTLQDISIANPDGYQKPQAVKIGKITVAGEKFSKELLTLARVAVEDTTVYLEVRPQGTNLGDLKKNVEVSMQSPVPQASAKTKAMKVIVRDVLVTKAQLNPSAVLIEKDLAFITVPDIHVTGIGEEQNGVTPSEAIGQVMASVLQELNRSANAAGFLEGLPLEVMNEIGVSTLDVFNKNLKKNAQKKVDEIGAGVETLKNLFAQ